LQGRTLRRRSRTPGDLHKHVLGATLMAFALSVLAAGLYAYATATRAPSLDHDSLCPIDGPGSVTVVLLDSTDDLPDIAKREIKTTLSDVAEMLPAYRLLDVRLLDPAVPGGRAIFSRCNPGDGSGLSEYTANPRLAKRRWIEGFRQPLEEALNVGFRPAPSKTSPIMETVQRIAIDRFTGRAAENIPKSLLLVSDMLEHEADYSQYQGDLSFARYKASHAYRRLRTDLHGAEVTIYYVQRLTARPINSADHIRFWAEWVRDNNGRLKQASKLQGEG